MSAVADPMLEAAQAAKRQLAMVSMAAWAEVFVELKMDFWRKFSRGFVCSTQHGVDYFDNVVVACRGVRWEEPGEFGENFRRMIRDRPR